MRRATAPLFRFDPGWLFVFAGVVACTAGVLLPAQSDLHTLRSRLDQLNSEEVRAYELLKAHATFLANLDAEDPVLLRRLAASQLNLMPEGQTPVLLASSVSSPITDWIDATVEKVSLPRQMGTASRLSQLAAGPHRLWLFFAGVMCVFVGLLIDPGVNRLRRSRSTLKAADEPEPMTFADDTLNDIEIEETADGELVEDEEFTESEPTDTDLRVSDEERQALAEPRGWTPAHFPDSTPGLPSDVMQPHHPLRQRKKDPDSSGDARTIANPFHPGD